MTFTADPASSILSTDNSSTSNVGGSTTLNEGGQLSAVDATITVTDGSVFSDGQTIKIDSEYIIIGTVSTNDLTGCARGQFNSTATTHEDGATVTGVYIGTSELVTQPDVMVSLKSDKAGTEYFDFSNDNTNWDTFPVSGFTVAANIHEFHTAVKGRRYFRIRFENGSSSATTSFRVSTYYGVFRQGNLPLNQSIGADSDSIIVRAVGVGADPNGSYSNQYVDGYIIDITGIGNLPYTSSILDLSGYTQIQTEVYSDVNGTLTGTWYDDSLGTNTLRTFTFPYTATQELQTFSAPAFTQYLRYAFSTSDTNVSKFLLKLKLITKAISGQVLGV